MVTVTDMSRTGNGSRTLRRYDVRSEKGAWLGTFVIADDGYFSAVTDFGTYGYWWSSAGECFRSFLARTEIDAYELACRSYPNEARNFATQVWPRFVMMLREELAAERAAVAGAA